MAARDVVRRIPTYLVCAMACFAMFDVPSAYAYFRGAPWGVALAAGLFVFPVLPVTWHVWAERRAKNAEKPKPKKTTGVERFVFRTIVVAVIALGGLIAIARGSVWTAIKNDALWFIPTSLGSLEPDSKLLDKVPPSAQVVVWVRPTEDANALVGKVAPGTKVTEVVIGGRADEKDGQGVVIERGDLLIPLIAKMQAMVTAFTANNGVALPAWGSIVSSTGGVKTWATPGWVKEIGTGRAPVIELVRRAPEDAFLVAVARIAPTTPSTTTPSTTTPSTTTPSTTTPSTTTPSTTTPSTTTPSTTTPSTTTPSTTTPSTTTPSTTTPSTTTPSAGSSSSSVPTNPSVMFAKLGASDELVAQGLTALLWARAPHERLEVDVRIETANDAAATKLLELANNEIAAKEKTDAKQIACWRKHSDELYVRREGASVHARVVIDVDGMKGLFNCLDMAKK